MEEFVALFHCFLRSALSPGPLELYASQAFHESSVDCSLIQSDSTLEMTTTGRRSHRRSTCRSRASKTYSLEVLFFSGGGGKTAGERSKKNSLEFGVTRRSSLSGVLLCARPQRKHGRKHRATCILIL